MTGRQWAWPLFPSWPSHGIILRVSDGNVTFLTYVFVMLSYLLFTLVVSVAVCPVHGPVFTEFPLVGWIQCDWTELRWTELNSADSWVYTGAHALYIYVTKTLLVIATFTSICLLLATTRRTRSVGHYFTLIFTSLQFTTRHRLDIVHPLLCIHTNTFTCKTLIQTPQNGLHHLYDYVYSYSQDIGNSTIMKRNKE